MAKMTQAQARRRLAEADRKILRVMLAGHMSPKLAVEMSNKLNAQIKRMK